MYSMAKMLTNTMTVMILLLSAVSTAGGQVLDVEEFGGCEGAPRLVFYGENYVKLREEQDQRKTKINLSEVEKIKAEGCGCFYIYSGRNYKGGSEYFSSEQVIDRNQIRFNKVQSIEQVDCTQQASPYALVIGAVVGAVILVAAVLVIATKIYRRRQFQGVSTSENA